MSAIRPLIAIKAGKCTQSGNRIIPLPEPGLLYLYNNPDDDFPHICWKPRSAQEPEQDLIIMPSDMTFTPYTACSTGRVFVLKFSSSSQRHFYWLQAKAESDTNPGYWSSRDRQWGEIIDRILQGHDDDDEEMGDPDAELGSEDIEEEGSASRRGGADGGRAESPSPFAISRTEPQTQNDFLKSLISSINVGETGGGPLGTVSARYLQQTPTISLHDLLPSSTTVPLLTTLSPPALNQLTANLPPALVPRNATDAQKRDVVGKVLQSPQFCQSLISLTVALRDGALKGVADSLGVLLSPGGEEGGADQVEIFVRGVKKGVEKDRGEESVMDID